MNTFSLFSKRTLFQQHGRRILLRGLLDQPQKNLSTACVRLAKGSSKRKSGLLSKLKNIFNSFSEEQGPKTTLPDHSQVGSKKQSVPPKPKNWDSDDHVWSVSEWDNSAPKTANSTKATTTNEDKSSFHVQTIHPVVTPELQQDMDVVGSSEKSQISEFVQRPQVTETKISVDDQSSRSPDESQTIKSRRLKLDSRENDERTYELKNYAYVRPDVIIKDTRTPLRTSEKTKDQKAPAP